MQFFNFSIEMKKIYATYRRRVLNDWSWWYTPSYFFDKMFWDYKQVGLTSIDDNLISDDKYTGELVPWIKKLSRLLVWNYNENYVTKEEFSTSLVNTGAEFHIFMFDTLDEVKQWIRDNTSLEEETDWVFVLDRADGFTLLEDVLLTIE